MTAGATNYSPQLAADALGYIDPGCERAEWVKVAMAAKAAGLDFDAFDAWSEAAPNYTQAGARDTWRSIQDGGGITAGTFYYMARAAGWPGPDGQRAAPPNPSKATGRPHKPAAAPRPGMGAAAVWERCKPATASHGYIEAKQGRADGLRVVPEGDPLKVNGQRMAGALVVPVVPLFGGPLSSLVFVAPPDMAARWKAAGLKSSKLNLPRPAGAPAMDGAFIVGEVAPGGLVYIVEGIATAWACWKATGSAAVACFGWGRVRGVAQELRQRDGAARLVLCPDAGKEADADKIAADVGAAVATMPEGEPVNFDAADYAQREGFDALEVLLSSAGKPAPPPLPFAVVPFADLATVEPAPPAYVWEGLVPAGHVTLLSAHGGTGKSLIALMLAVAVALGLPLFGIPTRRGVVAFYSGEDGAGLLRYRLRLVCRAMGVSVEDLAGRLFILDATEGDPTLFAEVTAGGRREGVTTATYSGLRDFANLHAVSLLVLDNASDTFDAHEIDRARVRGFMRALARIARERDAGVLLLAHVDKGTSRGDRGPNSEGYSGSTAWHNSARSRLFMARDKDGALTLEHQKHNLGKLREPLHLFWPEGGIPQADEAPGPVVQGIANRGHTKALLKLISEFTARGEFVGTATTSRTHAAKLLHQEPTYPKCKDGEAFDLLRRAERAGHLERVAYTDAWRKPRERWQVTPAGAEAAGIPAVTAATAATTEVTAPAAPAATPAVTAATSPLGGVGESAPHEVTAQAAAGGVDGC